MAQAVIKFNVGGVRYEVSQSLLDSYPDSMLAQSASENWQKDPNEEIFIERNGLRFQFVLDYLRDGHVNLPGSVSKAALLTDLKFYGFESVKDGAIVEQISTFSFGNIAALSMDVRKKWERDEKILKDCITIYDNFLKDPSNRILMA